MVTATPSNIWEKTPYEIMKLSFERSQLKWYQFSEKRRLDKEIETLKAFGWNIGVDIALSDLRESGIII